MLHLWLSFFSIALPNPQVNLPAGIYNNNFLQEKNNPAALKETAGLTSSIWGLVSQ